MYSDNIEYARGRLLDTIVMYQGEPVLIKEIDDDAVAVFEYLQGPISGECEVDELDLVGQNKLGYVNYGISSYHVVRKPLRYDWRQGLRPGNFVFTGEVGFRAIPAQEFRNTILGIYPSFDQSVALVTDLGYEKVAFSRHFALHRDGSVLYRERKVGSFDKIITLQEKFKYLSEYVNDLMEGNYAYD